MDDCMAGNVGRYVVATGLVLEHRDNWRARTVALEMHVMVRAKLGSPFAVCGEEAREAGMSAIAFC